MDPPQDNAPADGWHIGVHDAHYLTRDGVVIAVAYSRLYLSGIDWHWWDFTTGAGHSGHPTLAAAKSAAEDATK